MKEVFVLYGRKNFSDGVINSNFEYFVESPVLELYENFSNAFEKLQIYIIDICKGMREYGDEIIADYFEEAIAKKEIFNNINAENEGIGRWATWSYLKHDDYFEFEIRPLVIPTGSNTPILPSLYIKKVQIN